MYAQSQRVPDRERTPSVNRPVATQISRSQSKSKKKTKVRVRLSDIERTVLAVKMYMLEHKVSEERPGKLIALRNIEIETRRLNEIRKERERRRQEKREYIPDKPRKRSSSRDQSVKPVNKSQKPMKNERPKHKKGPPGRPVSTGKGN